ncbi:MAG: class I SAM-dependent methyltransferase, partial [Acidobacteriota bacterium]
MPRHPLAVSKRPEGQATRGKTARHRLRAVDTLIALYDPGLLRRRGAGFSGALCVDLGFGAEPHTTLESARRWRRLAPDLPFLGVEIDPERVEAA